jgi:hypothetical protein
LLFSKDSKTADIPKREREHEDMSTLLKVNRFAKQSAKYTHPWSSKTFPAASNTSNYKSLIYCNERVNTLIASGVIFVLLIFSTFKDLQNCKLWYSTEYPSYPKLLS